LAKKNPLGHDTWRFHPVMCHAVQPGGKTENLEIAKENHNKNILQGNAKLTYFTREKIY
jgi:hypothetical protein